MRTVPRTALGFGALPMFDGRQWPDSLGWRPVPPWLFGLLDALAARFA